jgi:hypothetical protein
MAIKFVGTTVRERKYYHKIISNLFDFSPTILWKQSHWTVFWPTYSPLDLFALEKIK